MFVVLPCTYVLNRDVTKQSIVLGNWYQGIKSIFVPTEQVAPMAGGNAAPPNIPAPARNVPVTPQPPAQPGIAAQSHDTSPPNPSGTGNSNASFGKQQQNSEIIPLSSVCVIQVASAN